MKIVVIGDGKVGYTLTQALSKEGHDLMVVDSQKTVLDRSEEALDVMVLQGNGACLEVQKKAGVGDSDLLIAVTSADEINLLCCMVARKLGCPHAIARIRNPEYRDHAYFLRDELGLSMTVNPENLTATEIVRLLQFPSFLHRDAFAKGRAEIVELPVNAGSMLDGLRLTELYGVLKVRVLVCAVERGDDVFIPDGTFTLRAGDNIYVTAPTRDLVSMVKSIAPDTTKIKSALIVGGSRIAVYLAQQLLETGIRVKIIEMSHERCMTLSAMMPRATVVCGDGTALDTLLAEGIEETDAVVTLTNIDEGNMVISMFANRLHVPKVVTKINRTEYMDMLRDAGINCVISPRLLTCNDIIRYVRAMQNKQGAGVITLHRMVGQRVEALEFLATGTTWYLDTPLSAMPLKDHLLIAAINHKGDVRIPAGSDRIYSGDTVVVVTTADRSFNDLNDVFTTPMRGADNA